MVCPVWGSGSVSEDADSQKPRPVVKTERGGMGATLLIEGERELARRFEALSSSKGGEWAWVELNYRPHAYQAICFDFHRRHSAVSVY